MAAIVLYFHVHQPFRVKPYSIFQSGHDHDYFTANSGSRLDNQKILNKVANKCYLPATKVLKGLIDQYPEFKISFSISGPVIEQFELFAPQVLQSFQGLAATGNVEFLTETYNHSLSFLYSKPEFHHQIKLHHQKIQDTFNYTPTAFRNTELIYNNEIASEIDQLGYQVILAEGIDHILGWRNPNFVYQPVNAKNIKLLLKNYRLSDDIAFRFSDQSWSEWPLNAEKYAHWVSQVNSNGHLVNLFMDFETLGEHQWADTGIFDFLQHLPQYIYQHPDNRFMTVTEAAHAHPIMDTIDMHQLTSWADTERDLSAWLSNPMQHSAIQTLYDLQDLILKTQDRQLINDWRHLQSSDHFYYMCTKWFNDGDVHKYFNPYETPYDAFINYMNVLHDLRHRAETHPKNLKKSKLAKKKSTSHP